MKKIPVHFDGKIVAAAIVDDADFERVNERRWTRATLGYAVSSRDLMHRFICGLDPGDPRAVHHVNEDKMDNRRANLMVCASRSESARQPHPLRVSRPHTATTLRLYSFEELLAMVAA